MRDLGGREGEGGRGGKGGRTGRHVCGWGLWERGKILWGCECAGGFDVTGRVFMDGYGLLIDVVPCRKLVEGMLSGVVLEAPRTVDLHSIHASQGRELRLLVEIHSRCRCQLTTSVSEFKKDDVYDIK